MSLPIRLNRKITIQQQSTAKDEIGQRVISWSDFATVWAEVKDVSGKEYLSVSAVQGSVNTKITIRHIDGLEPAMRVLCGSSTYNIDAVLGQDNRTLLLMCNKV